MQLLTLCVRFYRQHDAGRCSWLQLPVEPSYVESDTTERPAQLRQLHCSNAIPPPSPFPGIPPPAACIRTNATRDAVPRYGWNAIQWEPEHVSRRTNTQRLHAPTATGWSCRDPGLVGPALATAMGLGATSATAIMTLLDAQPSYNVAEVCFCSLIGTKQPASECYSAIYVSLFSSHSAV